MAINNILTINIKTIDNNENVNSNSERNKDNNDVIENFKNINNKGNNHKNMKEEININESIKVDGINNNSITSNLVKESNVIDSKNSKINNIQIIPNNNKNEQFTNTVYSVNSNINIEERKIINNNSPIDEFSKVINVGSDKEIKINIIKKKIKISNIHIRYNNKNKINTNKILMPKPEIAFKEIISYNNNRVDTKRTIRNYRYKRK